MLSCFVGSSVSAQTKDDSDYGETAGIQDTLRKYDESLTAALNGGPLADPLPISLTHLSKAILIDNGMGNVKCSWYYRYYVKTSKNAAWTRLAETSDNTYVYNTDVGGKTYYFTVRAVSHDGKFLTKYQTHSIYYCNTPGSLKADQMSRGIKVSWDKCYGVTKYRLYRKTPNGWTKLVDTPNNYFVDTNPYLDEYNCYTVRGLDSDGDWCTYYKTQGIKCYQGGPNKTINIVDDLVKAVKSQSDYSKVGPQTYWNYSGIPDGCDWCTGFANWVIGKSCGSWRFAGEYHSGCTFNWNYEESTGHGNYNNPADWHPYTSQWSKWAYLDHIFYQPWELNPKKGDIVFFRKYGADDTFANVGHVGIVVESKGNTLTTVEGNADGRSPDNARVRLYTYTKCKVNGRWTWCSSFVTPKPADYSGTNRLVSGFIRMEDIYNRKIYK